MTDDDKRRQKGDLLLSFQEAVDNLAAQEEELRRYRDVMTGIVDWLTGVQKQLPREGDLPTYFSRALAMHINVLADPVFKKAMDIANMQSMYDQYVSAHKRVWELRERKTALGLK
ncbi:MAG: hypothetical protein QOJ51_208 [Acidobacteriaceae bacterium]|jgi:hypothetical protein|nr:hypothetical protein [Acidobacteriaceae bacterium]